MYSIAFIITTLVSATHAFTGYRELDCDGAPALFAPCDGSCQSFYNLSSFMALDYVREAPRRLCVEMWTEPGCTGVPYVYSDQRYQCTAVTFHAASFRCADECSV